MSTHPGPKDYTPIDFAGIEQRLVATIRKFGDGHGLRTLHTLDDFLEHAPAYLAAGLEPAGFVPVHMVEFHIALAPYVGMDNTPENVAAVRATIHLVHADLQANIGFKQLGTVTGRTSSSKPNIAQVMRGRDALFTKDEAQRFVEDFEDFVEGRTQRVLKR